MQLVWWFGISLVVSSVAVVANDRQRVLIHSSIRPAFTAGRKEKRGRQCPLFLTSSRCLLRELSRPVSQNIGG
ncbi:MAG: hypothetical protein ACI9G1_001340 [Pirellulaceae bacterium]|jgi:hypothetical protein